MKFNNRYYLMRHGHPISHERGVLSCWPEKFENPLTEKGRREVRENTRILIKKDISLIFSSDIQRAKETAEIVGEILGIKPRYDKRIREQQFGVLNGKSVEIAVGFFGPKGIGRFGKRPLKGEEYKEIEKRMSDFIKSIDKKYKGKNILIVGHELPLMMLVKWFNGVSDEDFYKKRKTIETAEIQRLN